VERSYVEFIPSVGGRPCGKECNSLLQSSKICYEIDAAIGGIFARATAVFAAGKEK